MGGGCDGGGAPLAQHGEEDVPRNGACRRYNFTYAHATGHVDVILIRMPTQRGMSTALLMEIAATGGSSGGHMTAT